MSEQREMTLDEWCQRLPTQHLVNRQLTDLRTELAAAKEREERLREDNQKLRRQLSVDGKRLNKCMNHASQIARDRDRLLGTVKMAYLKHCLNRDAIGWEELDQALLDTLCDVIGDDGYQEWLNRHRM